MLKDQPFYCTHDDGRNTFVAGKHDGVKPELAFPFGRFNMNVRRLVPFVGIEMEAEGAYSQDGWHSDKSFLGHIKQPVTFLCAAQS